MPGEYTCAEQDGRGASRAVAAAVLSCLVAGCSSPRSPVEDVASRFYEAVAASRWASACGYLAPRTQSELEQSVGKPCPAALSDEGLADAGRLDGSTTFGTMGQVRLAEDTVFVAEFQDGWKVTAADCTPVGGHPYDCRLEG